MSSKGKVASVRVKDVNVFELTPGLADALSASLDASYQEYFTAACSGTSTKEAERRIAAIPEGKRYLTRVLDSIDSAFADFDTETAMLDLPHMQDRKAEAIKRYLLGKIVGVVAVGALHLHVQVGDAAEQRYRVRGRPTNDAYLAPAFRAVAVPEIGFIAHISGRPARGRRTGCSTSTSAVHKIPCIQP